MQRKSMFPKQGKNPMKTKAFMMDLLGDRKRWALVLLGLLILGGAWIWLSAVPATATTGGEIPSPREGFAAPSFSLETLDGEMVALQDLRGKVVIVNLWATWCPPCRAEMAAIERVYRANVEKGFVVLGIHTTFQDSQQAARGFVQDFDLTFPILLDRTGEVSRQYQLRALPSTFFIDRSGIIQRVVVGGPMSEATLETSVQELLRED